MKRVCFLKIDEKLKLPITIGYKEFEKDTDDNELHAFGKKRCKEMQEIMHNELTYHIEKQLKDGSWVIQAYLQPEISTIQV